MYCLFKCAPTLEISKRLGYNYTMTCNFISPLTDVLERFHKAGKIPVAVLFGSYASGTSHGRSDIDLALFVRADNLNEEIEIIDKVLMSDEREISILRLDDEDESPFVVQEALKGVHLVESDKDCLYEIADRALHETEGIRFRREMLAGGQI